MTRVAIIGAGDLGVTLAHHATTAGLQVNGFFDDTRPGETVVGLPVLGGLADVVTRAASLRTSLADAECEQVLMAIGYHHMAFREKLFEDLSAQGIHFCTLVHPSAYVDRSATLESGVVVFPGCVIDAGVQIGRNTVLNTGCIVAHDTHIGAHSFLGPGVHVAGFTRTGRRCFFGIGSIVIDKLTLGDDIQTGGGAVVIGSHPGGALLVGNPARVVVRNV
jgi:sugar O-acyltransferase (sialic acid O-acetyltransferase NeuD family)